MSVPDNGTATICHGRDHSTGLDSGHGLDHSTTQHNTTQHYTTQHSHNLGAGHAPTHCHTQGQRKPTKPTTLTATEKRFRRNSILWLVGASTLVLGYIALSGKYFDVS